MSETKTCDICGITVPSLKTGFKWSAFDLGALETKLGSFRLHLCERCGPQVLEFIEQRRKAADTAKES